MVLGTTTSLCIEERVIPVIVIVIVGEASEHVPIGHKSMLVFQVDVSPVICSFRSGVVENRAVGARRDALFPRTEFAFEGEITVGKAGEGFVITFVDPFPP